MPRSAHLACLLALLGPACSAPFSAAGTIDEGSDASGAVDESDAAALGALDAPSAVADTSSGATDATIAVVDAGAMPDRTVVTVDGGPAVLSTTSFGEAPDAQVKGASFDTTLYEENATSNFGGSPTLHADSMARHVVLVRFDLSSILPRTPVVSADMRIWTSVCQSCELLNGNVSVYRMLEEWDEGTTDGAGGGATYLQRKPGVPWASPGAGVPSHEAASLAGFFPGAQGMQYSFSLPPALIERWIDDPALNAGMALESTSPTGDGVSFESSESATPARRPVLTVKYMASGVRDK